MNPGQLAGLAALAALALPAAAQPVVYDIDPDRSAVVFEVLHFGTSTIRGRFGGVQGEVMIDRSAGQGRASVRVATAGVSMGLPFFDSRMRQPDMLASTTEPEAFFVATRLSFVGEQLRELRGEFTLRGISHGLTLRAQSFACHVDTTTQRQACGGDFEGEFLRSSFGITFGLPFVADRVRLLVQVEGLRR